MEDFMTLLSQTRKRDINKRQEYNKASRERLLKICASKIRTTMIGALDSIEKKLGKFWTPEFGDKPNNEQLILKKLYEEIRQEILDRGNAQIRNLETEFEQYEIEWKRYQIKLPIKDVTTNKDYDKE
jgi:hypothetical protein